MGRQPDGVVRLRGLRRPRDAPARRGACLVRPFWGTVRRLTRPEPARSTPTVSSGWEQTGEVANQHARDMDAREMALRARNQPTVWQRVNGEWREDDAS